MSKTNVRCVYVLTASNIIKLIISFNAVVHFSILISADDTFCNYQVTGKVYGDLYIKIQAQKLKNKIVCSNNHPHIFSNKLYEFFKAKKIY